MYCKIHPVSDTFICVVFAALADCAFKQQEYGLFFNPFYAGLLFGLILGKGRTSGRINPFCTGERD